MPSVILLIELAAIAIIFAGLPLLYLWKKPGFSFFQKLNWALVFMTFDLIVFGAFTRLTDSGLGCPDWPGCYGTSTPFHAMGEIREAESALPTGPVTVMKAWIEMIHRYLAMGVGVLIIASLVIGWRLWRSHHVSRYAPKLPAFLLFFVCLQGAFGAWTVTLKLQPVIVTTHLLLGLSLLALLTWHALRQSEHLPVADIASALRLPAALALFAAFIQIALGGWVSTNYAALACGGFPLCQGALMPSMDFTHGFTLWRALGMTAAGDYLPFDALIAIHWVHRVFALIVVGLVAWTAHRAWKTPGTERLGRALLWLILLQFCTGMATVLLDWPLTIAVLHNAGAALLVLLLTMLNYRLSQPVEKAAEFRASHSPA